jgi:hypothetical protein
VDDADDEAFRKDASRAFAFWEADPTAEGLRSLEDYATIRVTLPRFAAATTRIFLSMPLAFHNQTNTWDLKRKVVNGKDYLSTPPLAATQLADMQNDSLQPTSVALGTYRADIAWISEPRREFLVRCRPRADGSRGCPTPVIQLEREVEGKRVAIVSRRIDFLPMPSLMTVYSAHSGPIPFAPAARLRRLPNWTHIDEDVGRITLLVHGFNVTESDAEAFSYPTMFKRLYWVGHPVMNTQDAATVGIAWPGDERALPETEPLYFPDDEYNALQTGVPLSAFFNQLRSGHPSIAIDVIAHSLGNMVVNSALRLSEPRVLDRYVMIDAAVPAEAFDPDYIPDEQELTQMTLWAVQNGYPDDAIWRDQWRTMLEFSAVPVCSPDLLDCSKSHYQRWQDKLSLVNPKLRPKPEYAIRWRKARFGNSPWRGLFKPRPGGPAVYNFFSATDHLLRIDTNLPPSAWRASQIIQKPKVPGLLGTLPRDNERTQYWALLDNTSVSEEYLWASADPGNDHSGITREWAELAYWFQPVSGPVGSMPLRGVSSDRNVSMADIGGGDSPFELLLSHTYPTQRALPEVWKLYERLGDVFYD